MNADNEQCKYELKNLINKHTLNKVMHCLYLLFIDWKNDRIERQLCYDDLDAISSQLKTAYQLNNNKWYFWEFLNDEKYW